MVKRVPARFRFRSEKDLEDYLETRLWHTGEDLLVIGRQLKIARNEIDLLAIDSTGLIYVVELKLHASPSVIAQVLCYRRAFKGISRENLIRVVANGKLQIDLEEAFQQRFGHPLPENVQELPALIIIAEDIHRYPAYSILGMLDSGEPVKAFRYEVEELTGAVRLVPCCRSGRDVKEGTHIKKRPSARPGDMISGPRRPVRRVPIDENVRRFWLTHAQDFKPFVTFKSVYERYSDWVDAQADDGIHLYQSGHFGSQLSALTAESGEWTRVYIAPQDTMAVPSSPRTYRAMGYTRAAYQLNPVGADTEL